MNTQSLTYKLMLIPDIGFQPELSLLTENSCPKGRPVHFALPAGKLVHPHFPPWSFLHDHTSAYIVYLCISTSACLHQHPTYHPEPHPYAIISEWCPKRAVYTP